MELSRLRLRLTGSYAIGFFVALVIFNLAVVQAVRRMDEGELTRRLALAARDLLVEVPREFAERPEVGWGSAAARVLDEWPSGSDALVVYGPDGSQLAALGSPDLLATAPRTLQFADDLHPDTLYAPDHRARRVMASSGALTSLAIGSLDDARRAADALGFWLFRLVPALLLASLAVGYVFAGRALAPMRALGERIAGLAPDRLDARLPVATPPDEVDRLAMPFNALLARLQRAQSRNRRFVQQAAHQIRTPLTILVGEASLQRTGHAGAHELRQAMDRIWISAQQMQRRVNELVTLAAAEAGDRPPMDDQVELDALALESMDLIRHRAAMLGHRLELQDIEAVTVRGNLELLREALVELLENACRHGSTAGPVGIRVVQRAGRAHLEVISYGPPVATPHARVEEMPADGRGLGLSIVRWIAESHGGLLEFRREDDHNVISLTFPRAP